MVFKAALGFARFNDSHPAYVGRIRRDPSNHMHHALLDLQDSPSVLVTRLPEIRWEHSLDEGRELADVVAEYLADGGEVVGDEEIIAAARETVDEASLAQ